MFKKIHRSFNEPNLKLMLPILEKENIEYFMFYGSLLGIVREGNILEMDDDIDICVNLKHREQLYAIIEKHFDKIDTKEHPNHSPYFLQATRMRAKKELILTSIFMMIKSMKQILLIVELLGTMG